MRLCYWVSGHLVRSHSPKLGDHCNAPHRPVTSPVLSSSSSGNPPLLHTAYGHNSKVDMRFVDNVFSRCQVLGQSVALELPRSAFDLWDATNYSG